MPGPVASCRDRLGSWQPDREKLLQWLILLSAVIYRLVLFFELRSIGFFNLVFVDNKATMDISFRFLDGELPGPLMKSSLWFIQFQAVLLRLGVDLEGLHLIQYLSGILLVGTVLTLGKKVFGSTASLIAGGILAFYGPLLFQESQLLAASWAALFLTLAVLLPLAFSAPPSAAVFILSGLIMGLGVQSQANMVLAAATFFIGLWFGTEKGKRAALLAFPLGVMLALLPLTVHNLRSGEMLPLSALGGLNFFIGNGPGANGSFTLPEGYSLVNNASDLGPSSLIYPEEVLKSQVSYTEASSFWTMLTLRHMAAHPFKAFSVLGKKAVLLIQGWELQNNFSYYFFRTQQVKLPMLLDFGILFALSIPWFFQRNPFFNRGPLLWATGGYALSVILFFVVDRYRLPLVPMAALMAGAGMVELRTRWVSGGVRGVRGLIALVVLALLLTHIPGWSSPEGEIAQSWNYFASDYYRNGRQDDAALAYTKALEAQSDNRQALFSLASLYAKRGEFGKAEVLYRRVLDKDSTDEDTLVQLGRVLQDSGNLNGALEIFRFGMTVFPDNAGFYEGAAGVYLETGQVERSSDILRNALERGLRNSALALIGERIRSALREQ